MKTHSRKDITDKAGELNDCIKHGRKQVVEEIIAGNGKISTTLYYVTMMTAPSFQWI